MRCYLFLSFVFLLTFTGCDIGQREREIKKRTSELDKKEQLLSAKEKELQLKEEALQAREASLDSVRHDTVFIHHPEIVGRWDVKMQCIETDCPGSAIGDTKTEQWEIAYRGRAIIAKVVVNKAIVRIYTGSFEANALKLISQSYESDPAKTTIMQIRLQLSGEGRMEGIRAIDRPDNCLTVFNLQLEKKHS